MGKAFLGAAESGRLGVTGYVGLFLMLAGGAADANPPGLAPSPDGPGLRELAAQLASAPPDARAHFARCAVGELDQAYAQEAARARAVEGAGHSAGQWARKAEGFRGNLGGLAERLAAGAEVSVEPGPGELIYLFVNGSPLVIDDPRAGPSGGLAQAIQSCHCADYPCHPRWIPSAPQARAGEPPPSLPVPVRIRWSFSAGGGAVCDGGQGLEFRFHNADQLPRKRELCQKLAEELVWVLERLKQLHAFAEPIDSDALEIRSSADGQDQRLLFNRQGAYVRLALPYLAERPALVPEAACWLAERAAGGDAHLVIPQAERWLSQASADPARVVRAGPCAASGRLPAATPVGPGGDGDGVLDGY